MNLFSTEGEAQDLGKELSEEDFDASLLAIAKRMLFGTDWIPILEAKPKHLSSLDFMRDVPMLCRVQDCAFYRKCPVMRELEKSAQDELRNTDCRVEKIFGLSEFVKWVRYLELGPDSTPDLLGISNLVKHLIQLRRIEQKIAIDGIMTREPVLVYRMRDEAVERDIPHPLLKERERLEKAVNVIQNQLMVTKEKRLLEEEMRGKTNDHFDRLMRKLEEKKASLPNRKPPLSR